MIEVLRDVNQLTKIKAKNNSKLLIIIGGSLAPLLTFVFYSAGIFQTDPLYREFSLIFGLPMMTLTIFNAIAFTGIGILYIKSLGEYSSPKIVNGYWNIASRFILRDKFKKNMSDGIWDYVKLHRKHDPLYQADLEKLNKKIDSNSEQHQKDLEVIFREIRRKNLVIDKLHTLKNQAERERDQAIQERDQTRVQNTKLTNLIRKLLTTIFQLEQIIKKLKGE